MGVYYAGSTNMNESDLYLIGYFAIALILMVISTVLFKNEIVKAHTETGSKIIVLSLVWAPLLIIGLVATFMLILEKILMYLVSKLPDIG